MSHRLIGVVVPWMLVINLSLNRLWWVIYVPSSSNDGFVHEHRIPRAERLFAGSVEVVNERSSGSATGSLLMVETGSVSKREGVVVGRHACKGVPSPEVAVAGRRM